MRVFCAIYVLMMYAGFLRAAATDSMRIASLSVGVSTQSSALNSFNHNLYDVQLGVKDSMSTVLFSVQQKRIFDSYNYKLGADYYRSFNGGYFHGRVHYGISEGYPQFDLSFKGYKSLSGGFEMNAGYRNLSFRGEKGVHFLQTGVSKYLASWILSYDFTYINEGNYFHRASARNMIGSKGNYVECSFGRSLGNSVTGIFMPDLTATVESLSLGAKLHVTNHWVLNVSCTSGLYKDSENREGYLALNAGLSFKW